MFKWFRRLSESYKKFLFDQYIPKPTVYKIGNKKYIKVKRLNTGTKASRGPYIK